VPTLQLRQEKKPHMTLPKLSDLPGITADLIDRIENLEAYLTHNNQRITNLETRYNAIVEERGTRIANLEADIAQHQAGAIRRQHEVDTIEAQTRRDRWARKYRRTRR
jgi:vacuolar-type H+-ATPase subunit I/STV1